MVSVDTRENELKRVGDLFCELLMDIRIEGMRRFMEEWKAGRRDQASDTLRELSFMWEVAERVCGGEEEKGG